MLKKTSIGAAALVVALAAAGSANAAFTVGGENGWQLSTDGIIDVFSYYHSTTPAPAGARAGSLLDNGSTTSYNQRFGVGVGLLPSVVAFNVKAPTYNGVDSSVRIGIYPSISNAPENSLTNDPAARFSVGPHIDFREVFYTAKGSWGEILAGRALNLYQGKNILTDMTLLTAGVVGGRGNTVTLGHIASGYLYTGFGPQLRYTTPDFSGVKLAIEVGEPYNITADTAKTNSPRVEAELSYAGKVAGLTTQAWLAGIYQTAPRKDTAAIRPGKDDETIGGAYGVSVGTGGLNLLASGYGGRGLGMLSVQDADVLGQSTSDANGSTRLQWGYLLQGTYQLTPTIKLGANYGSCNQSKNDNEPAGFGGLIPMRKQESAVGMVTYNFTKNIQFVGEYIYAQNTWMDGKSQHSNQFALGTLFYW